MTITKVLYDALKRCVDTHDAIVAGFGKSDPPAIAQAREALKQASSSDWRSQLFREGAGKE